MRIETRRLLSFLLAGSLALLAGCASLNASTANPNPTAPPAPAKTAQSPSLVNVFFATGRKQSPEPEVFFGKERAELSYGKVDIGIPSRHLVGRNEEPSLLSFEWSPNDHRHITVQRSSNYSQDAFYYYLNKAIESSGKGKVLVFVHGYNTGFAEAARTLGQLGNDLKFAPVVLFSWPSQGTLTGYTVDETNVEWAQSQFVALLEGLIDRTPAKDIYVVGHSMGTRLIARGMTTLASDRPAGDLIRFRDIVLIAPDIDTDVFQRDVAPRLARTNIHVTLYASSGDNALMASKAFHGYARAGDSGEGLVVVPGVETIDASIATRGLLGHSYFTEDPRVMEDLFSLLQSGQRADNRFALHAVDGPDGRHWEFRK